MTILNPQFPTRLTLVVATVLTLISGIVIGVLLPHFVSLPPVINPELFNQTETIIAAVGALFLFVASISLRFIFVTRMKTRVLEEIEKVNIVHKELHENILNYHHLKEFSDEEERVIERQQTILDFFENAIGKSFSEIKQQVEENEEEKTNA